MSDLMTRGLELAMYGMGTVFIFLTLLVVVTALMSRIILASDLATSDQGAEGASTLDQDRRLVAVITAAVQRYRSEHG
jgi:oxaloacetate decarboxylase gamma subunit|tara:strand:- start:6913 stop:7146 length:234 start_codon:yes stop_codon:yes gene_type:complete